MRYVQPLSNGVAIKKTSPLAWFEIAVNGAECRVGLKPEGLNISGASVTIESFAMVSSITRDAPLAKLSSAAAIRSHASRQSATYSLVRVSTRSTCGRIRWYARDTSLILFHALSSASSDHA